MESIMDNQDNILEMRGICKRFPGVVALSDVDFDLRRGEVHVLMGANGAGKSTLMKVLSGVYPMGYEGVAAIDAVINGRKLEKSFFETVAKIITKDNIREPDVYAVMARNSTIKEMMTRRGITEK